MKVRIDYYAYFRDKRGVASEEAETDARTLGELYGELAELYGFKLPPACVKVVVDDEFVSLRDPVKEGSTVAFVPPVAGG